MESYMTSHEYVNSLAKALVPASRYDLKSDFAAWREENRKKLEELLCLPLIKPAEDKFHIEKTVQRDGYSEIHFRFQSEEGYFVPCCMLKPDGLTAKVPAAICLQGHSHGMHISLGIEKFKGDKASIESGRDFAVQVVKQGMIAVAVEQRYMGICGQSEWGDPACCANSGDSHSNEAAAALLMGRTAIGERVWDIRRTIDVLEAHFSDCVDLSRLICMGHSGGGTAMFYTGCLEDRINVLVPSGAVCTFEASIMAMHHCYCNFVPHIRKYFDMGDLGGLIAPKKLVIVSGKDDPIFPIDGVEEAVNRIQATYEHIGKGDIFRWIIGDGGHQFYPEDAWPAIREMLEK